MHHAKAQMTHNPCGPRGEVMRCLHETRLTFSRDSYREHSTMTMIKSLLSTLLLIVTIVPCKGSSAFSRGISATGGSSLFGIPRGGGLFGGNKADKYVLFLCCMFQIDSVLLFLILFFSLLIGMKQVQLQTERSTLP